MRIIAPLATLLLLAAPAAAEPVKLDVPMLIGGNAEFDACGGYGEIVPLRPPDDYLSVRSGPGGRYREIDRLKSADKVYICDDKGSWTSVVYPAGGDRDCNVSTPWPKRSAYNGPCKRGWIFSKYLKPLAG